MKLSCWRTAVSLRNMASLSAHKIQATHLTAPIMTIKERDIAHLQMEIMAMVPYSAFDCCPYMSMDNVVTYLPKKTVSQNLPNLRQKFLTGLLQKESFLY